MIKNEHPRIDPKRRQNLDPKKRQFAKPLYQQQEYKHRLNFYSVPPTADITLEEFEEWAIQRLKGTLAISPPLKCQLHNHHHCRRGVRTEQPNEEKTNTTPKPSPGRTRSLRFP